MFGVVKYLIAAVCVLMAGCSDAEKPPVPRRTAYPRVRLLPAEYVVPQGLPLPFAVNAYASASVGEKSDGSVWLTIWYPSYGATAYFTFTPVSAATAAEVMDNRAHRMALNLGAAAAQSYSFATATGMQATVLQSPTAAGAAVQALAVGNGWVVSASSVFPAAAADSIAPMVQAVTDDFITSLKKL